jgi:hypothetical protein
MYISSRARWRITSSSCSRVGRQTDPFVLHLYAALAEKERAMIFERTKAALAALAAANDGQIDSEVAGFEDNLRSVSEDWRREGFEPDSDPFINQQLTDPAENSVPFNPRKPP